MNIEKRVKELLENKEWTFVDLQNMKGIIDDFSDTIYQEMEVTEKLNLVWEVINQLENPKVKIGEIYYCAIMNLISTTVAKAVKEELMQANVLFGNKNKDEDEPILKFGNKNKEEDENEISEGSVGWKSLKERTANEKTDSK